MTKLGDGAAVITGAGGGVGRALAMKAAQAGYDVAVLDIDADAASQVAAEIVARGGKAIAVPCDVSLPQEVEEAAGVVLGALPDLRLVWANAGVAHLGGLVSGPPRGFDWIYAVNVQGTIDTLRAFVPHLMGQTGGRHVGLTASMSGLGHANAVTPAYAASKYAVIGLAEALRAELAGTGIGVTIACPGTVDTAIWDGARARPERFGGARRAPYEAGERHRTQGMSVDWVADRIWDQVEQGGGYVTPVTGPASLADFDRRNEEVRASFRFDPRSERAPA